MSLSAVKDNKTVPNRKTVKGPNLLDKKLQKDIITNYNFVNQKRPEFIIQNSALSSEMRCKELVDGDIACELPAEEMCIEFSVDELAQSKYDR